MTAGSALGVENAGVSPLPENILRQGVRVEGCDQGICPSHRADALLLEMDQLEQILVCLLVLPICILTTRKQCLISNGEA